jgi:tight adherence protein B
VTGGQALAGLVGAAAGLGMVTITVGLRTPAAQPHPRWRTAARRLRAQVVAPRAAGAVLAVAVVAVATRWPAGCVLAGLAAWFLPRALGPDREHARLLARTEAVAGWTEMLRDTLAAAAGLEQSILATEHNAPAPVREHVASLCARIRGGDRLTAALRAFAAGLADPAADLAVAALLLAAEQQARDLAPLLSALAESARQQAVMRMSVAAGRARVRTAARIIIGTTVLLTAAMITWSRPFLGPYDSPLGQLMLIAVGSCFAAAFWWLHRISRPATEPRMLASPAMTLGEAPP